MVVTVGAVVLAGCTSTSSEPSPDTRTAEAVPTSPVSPSSEPSSASPATPASSSRPASPASESFPSGGAVTAKDFASGLTSPWGVVELPDGSLLVSERDTTKIKRVTRSEASVVAEISAAKPRGEGGLLSLALSPDESTLFAYFTSDRDNRVVAMTWDGKALGEPEPILTGIPRAGNHDGGRLLFGPDDGYLYVSTGDAGDTSHAQNKRSLGGKILRITEDGTPAPGNPFNDEVFSYGHRNVQGLAFDDRGRLWASEFGAQTWDELNLITAGSNYGWPEAEGSAKIRGLTNPKVVWRTSEASPSGLAYWRGSLWMATLRGQRLWEIPLDGEKVDEPVAHLTNDYGRLRTLAVARDGDRLLLSTSNTDGRANPRPGDDRVLRITRSASGG